MEAFVKRYDPSGWDGLELTLNCNECGTAWKHRLEEYNTPPQRGQTIEVEFTHTCPGCGSTGTTKTQMTNVGPGPA